VRLEFSDVAAGYGAGPPVLTGMSFSLGPGLWLVTGPNGSGKTTLLRCAAGILPPRAGQVRLGAVDAQADPIAYRWHLGYAPQELLDLPETRAKAYLTYLAALKGVRPAFRGKRVAAVMDQVGLSDGAIDAYSTGMRRRLVLAAALLNDPDLLLLDEPTQDLDPAELVQLRMLLAELSADRIVLVATNLPDALSGGASGCLQITAGGVSWRGD